MLQISHHSSKSASVHSSSIYFRRFEEWIYSQLWARFNQLLSSIISQQTNLRNSQDLSPLYGYPLTYIYIYIHSLDGSFKYRNSGLMSNIDSAPCLFIILGKMVVEKVQIVWPTIENVRSALQGDPHFLSKADLIQYLPFWVNASPIRGSAYAEMGRQRSTVCLFTKGFMDADT